MTHRRYPPDLPTNIRDLVDLIRREVSARSIGHTTIRVGQGAITLRSADGQTVLGQLGSLPNGQMGLSVHIRGVVQDIREPFAEDARRITDVDRKAIKNAADIEKVGVWASNAQATANAAQASANAANTGVGRVGTWATNAQSTANDANNNANAAHGRIDDVDRLKASNARVNGVESTANSANNNSNFAHRRIDDIDQSKASNSRVDSVSSTASSARSAASSAQSAADSAAAAARAARVYAESLEGRLAYLEGRIREMS